MAEARSISNREDNYKGSSIDDPPMSRLFVIHNKSNTEQDFRDSFEKYGNVEDIWLLKDKSTGENKGIAYIKFSRTSDAAKALEELNGQCLGNSDRPIKVVVASNRQAGSKKQTENEQEKYFRLFLVIPKTSTEDDLKTEFSKYGDLESVSVIRDRTTGQPKGFAYVKYKTFYHAALAFENCSSKYKAVFADPKTSPKTHNSNLDNKTFGKSDESINNSSKRQQSELSAFMKMQNSINQPTCLEVTCSNLVNQDQLWRLFDIIPGLDYCQLTGGGNSRCQEATVVYTNPDAAVYAKEKLHGLEYPPGERLIVKLSGLDIKLDSSFSEKKFRKESICSIDLPPPAPLASSDAVVAKRCFIVLASNLPQLILKNVFSTFGNLIDVYLLPNKNCGYAKYASEGSAVKAIDTLNGAEICGVRVKVMEAQEPKDDGRKRMRREE